MVEFPKCCFETGHCSTFMFILPHSADEKYVCSPFINFAVKEFKVDSLRVKM